MQRITAIILMDNLTRTIHCRTWAFHEAEHKLAFWIDLPSDDEQRQGCIDDIIKNVDRVNLDLIPAAYDLMDSTEGAFGADERWLKVHNNLRAVIYNWLHIAKGVLTAEDAVAKARRS